MGLISLIKIKKILLKINRIQLYLLFGCDISSCFAIYCKLEVYDFIYSQLIS